MTLEELKAQLGEKYDGLLAEYGPALLAMSVAELQQFVKHAWAGETIAAFKLVLSKSSDAEYYAKCDEQHAENVADQKNEKRKDDMRNEIASAAVKALLPVVLALLFP